MSEEIDKFVDLLFNFDMKELEDETKFLENYKKIKQENQQLKEENKDMERTIELFSNSLYNCDLKRYKSVLVEIREYIENMNVLYECETYENTNGEYYFKYEESNVDEDLLQILDKVKE